MNETRGGSMWTAMATMVDAKGTVRTMMRMKPNQTGDHVGKEAAALDRPEPIRKGTDERGSRRRTISDTGSRADEERRGCLVMMTI